MGLKWTSTKGCTPLQAEYEAEMWAMGTTVKEFEEARGLPRWTVYPKVTDSSAVGFYMYELPKDHATRQALKNRGQFKHTEGKEPEDQFKGMHKYTKLGGKQKERGDSVFKKLPPAY